MNKLKKLYYKWLVVTDRLSETQFDCLCLGCENEEKDAFDLMRIYLANHRPPTQRMDKLYRYGDKLARLYMESLYTRDVSEKEQRHLVLFMPFKQGDVWPCKLTTSNIEELFDTERPYKIRMYVAKYKLPEKFEKLLVNRVKMEEPDFSSVGENSYKKVLDTYMWVNDKDKFRSISAQIALLSLADDQYFKHIVKTGGMKECLIKRESIEEIIAQNRKTLLSFLLRETRPDAEICDLITEHYPDLKNLAEICQLRAKIRDYEAENKKHYGAAFATPTEKECVKMGKEGAMQVLEKHPSPSCCALVAAEVPELSAKALDAVRNMAQKLGIA